MAAPHATQPICPLARPSLALCLSTLSAISTCNAPPAISLSPFPQNSVALAPFARLFDLRVTHSLLQLFLFSLTLDAKTQRILTFKPKSFYFQDQNSQTPFYSRTQTKKKKEEMEVKLWNDKREREMYENFAELFAIIKATEKLEKAYIRDVICPTIYETECLKQIARFKTLSTALKDTVPNMERFMDTCKVDCPAALNRLVVSGVPATVEHRADAAASATTSAAIVAECVQYFITAMDSLKLNMVAVDQVYPLLSDVYSSLNKLTILRPNFEGKIRMKDWLGRLSKMGAADELTEQQARQLCFDLESSYNAFMAALPNAGT